MASRAKAFEEAVRQKKADEETARAEQDRKRDEERRERQAAKRAKESGLAAEAESQAANAKKKEGFKNKFAMFEKKEGPTEEERIKTSIIQASQSRRFEKQMKVALSDEEMQGMSPMAIEMALRKKIGNAKFAKGEEKTFETVGSAAEEGESPAEGAAGETPPGEQRALPGISAPREPALSPLQVTQEMAALKIQQEKEDREAFAAPLIAPLEEEEEGGWGADDAANWQVVEDDGNGNPYYWNKVTDDTSYDMPSCLEGAGVFGGGVEDDPAKWEVVEDDGNGNPYYWNRVTNDTSYEKPWCLGGGGDQAVKEGQPAPAGDAAPAPATEAAAEPRQQTVWTQLDDTEGTPYYQCAETGAERGDKPVGQPIIALEDGNVFSPAEGGGWVNSETGEMAEGTPDGVLMIVED